MRFTTLNLVKIGGATICIINMFRKSLAFSPKIHVETRHVAPTLPIKPWPTRWHQSLRKERRQRWFSSRGITLLSVEAVAEEESLAATTALPSEDAAAVARGNKKNTLPDIAPCSTGHEGKKSGGAKSPKSKKAALPPFIPHPRWRDQLEIIREMRKDATAPVDLFGCSELGRRKATSPEHMRFQTLISSMLSSQTTDLVNEKAMGRLFDACGITIEGLEALGEEGIVQAIKPVSFYTAKAGNILKVCAILKTQYAGDIPRTFEELMQLPGVGPKMATLVCAYGWGEVVGICVDTHVHRISNRLGWANTWNFKNPKAQNPEKTRKLLESWMPKEHWKEVNPLLVGLGQQTCRAIAPKCWDCKLAAVCPSYSASAE